MLRRLLTLPILVVALILLSAQGAFAHATVVATSPADGQIVARAPQQVSVTFDEPVQLQFGSLRVFAPDGARADTGSPVHPGGHADQVAVGLAANLKTGTYTVSWRAVSADSHPVQGAFTFSVGESSATAANPAALNPAALNPSGSTTVGILYFLARTIAYAAFAVLVGAMAFLLAWWPAGAESKAVRVLLTSAWGALTAATTAILALQGPYSGGFGVSRALDTRVLHDTLSTRLGEALAIRLVLLALAAASTPWVFTRLPAASRRTRALAAVMAAVLIVGTAATWAVSGHAGTGIQTALAVPVDMAHIIAMAVWLGGLTVLAGVVLGRGGPTERGEKAQLVRHFSPVALSCVIILVGTGTYQSWRQVGSPAALTGTSYGRLLLVKLVGVLLLIGLGYLARTWIARQRDRDRTSRPDQAAVKTLRRSVAGEVAVGLCVLALTAALVNAPPARSAYAASTTGPVSNSAAFNTGGPGGSGTVQVVVDPARTGTDTVHLYTLGPTGTQQQVLEVRAALSLRPQNLGPLYVNLRHSGAGHLTGDVVVPAAGTWELAVTVRTDDIDETTVHIPITIR